MTTLTAPAATTSRSSRSIPAHERIRVHPVHLLVAALAALALAAVIDVAWFVLSPAIEPAARPSTAVTVESRTPASLDLLAHPPR